ncbi:MULTISPECIES: MBL fold metallo-hydrolase [Brevibacillus]|uniref:MBL fold metallo-hydrolase n=1 Tax=Brevibacillus porteri TaxID=2126350 RepID=A0ABX5FGQ0_9BACL|nr:MULTISPECIES: MBL fold metallo-hydrolase [Brevibacillus]MDC0760224.1 MBL fold metallo-hydrolase [Brevibacillus sp. AG]MED1802857.1 MBL fold metallo-hydrolase [Brevibacillus porteri]MED2134835.1 MBL fold metallo-hydrolase [Brevibacillus porteri]MED2747025.1 MBL fold metallo-hydrolase [Brevibacillus porteri]MED2812554.1 MBL fold metallo-hydrolase [Brevibacillus porteri]
MQATEPIYLGERIHLIDGFDMGWAERTGTYVIAEEELTLVETGPSPSVPYIKAGLAKLGYKPEQVKYIIVTHIHLDHAGGVGLFLKDCPNAKVVVHPKGARHLIDPSRLIAGARAVYHDDFDRLFDPIEAVLEEQILIRGDGDTLKIGENCVLEFLDSPGHANHHFSIYDPVSRGMFTGDTAGVLYPQLKKDGIHLVLPSTSPNQFDPDAMLASLSRFEARKLSRIYFGHFGMTEQVDDVYRQIREWLPMFVAEGETALVAGQSYNELSLTLFERVSDHLQSQGISSDHEVFEVLKLDLQVCSMGILDYLDKRGK